MKYHLCKIALIVLLLFACGVKAQDIKINVLPALKPTDFALADDKTVAGIIVDDKDYPFVKLAAGLFAGDINRVTGQLPVLGNHFSGKPTVIAGTIGKSAIVDQLIASGKIADADKIKGKWEASLWQVVENPAPGVAKALIIVGSDRRGTAYGLMQLSRQIGVSPWYWWADTYIKRQKILTVSLPNPVWDAPAVKYRGIFINDEDWGINQWARKNFEKDFGAGVGPKTYEKVFELMLRLKLNYIWPAMHEVSKEFGEIPENAELADKYGIVAGSSHCEPMLYNNVHWDKNIKGPWNYSTNRDSIYKYWEQTVKERKDKEAVWTVGIRGIHDRGMEMPPKGIPERITLMEQIFKDQRELISRNVTREFGPVSQSFIPYKEVLTLYDAGLKVPEDVTLMWVDDNFGYIRRFSNPEERKRPGGSGVYWHLSYYGSPHSYTWINTTPPALIWEEFEKAWDNQARNMWVINVGDIKPMETGIDYFSRLAWCPEAQKENTQTLFLKQFIAEHFDAELTEPVFNLLTEFYRLGTIRKPELMNRDWALSLSDKNSGQLRADYNKIMKQEQAVAGKLSAGEQPSYFEMIGFPAKLLAATGLLFINDRDMVLGADKAKCQANIDWLKIDIQNEVDSFNNKIAEGKWKYMMPGPVTNPKLPEWSSQVAWPWGETHPPDTSLKGADPVLMRMASSADGQIKSPIANWVSVAGLGSTANAMALRPVSLQASWDSTDVKAPALVYSFNSSGSAQQLWIDFLPTFRLYPGKQLRVAVGVDDRLIGTVEVPGSNGKEDEKGPNRNQGIRNNYVRAYINLPVLQAGNHKLFIRAVDPGIVVDKISFN